MSAGSRRRLVVFAFGDERLGGEHQAATLAAFCSAVRTTFTGSMTPCSNRSPYSSVAAL